MTKHRLIPALVLSLFAQTAAADAVTYLTDTLEIRTGEMIGMSETLLIVLDDDNAQVRLPIERLASVDAEGGHAATLPPMPDWAEPTRMYVDLIDGQRLIVDINEPDDTGVLYGTATGLGPARIPLERILRIARPGAPAAATPADTDTLRLANGDELTGFIASLGPIVEIESESGAIARIALDRVTELTLANPPEPARGAFVADSTGAVLLARTFEVDADGAFRLTVDAASLGVESNGEDDVIYQRRGVRFVGAELIADHASVVPLPAPTSADPTGGRRWTAPPASTSNPNPPARIGDIHLPAPASVRHEIPRNADRFACDIAHLGGEWTDCEAAVFAELRDGSRVRLGGTALSAERHAPGQSAAEIAADLPAGTVAIILEVQPGRFGAIQDSVVFRKPRLRLR